MTSGECIRLCRKIRGMTQKQLADVVGVPYQSIGQWETGVRNPKLSTLSRIAAALDVEVGDLLDGPQTFSSPDEFQAAWRELTSNPDQDAESVEFETGSRIKSARKKAGLTQTELGELIGVSGVAIMRYEKEQRQASLKTLAMIAAALGVDIGDLLGGPLDYRWISSDEQRPQIGSIGIDGLGNYPEVLTTIVELKTESGESLYFTERYLDEVELSKGNECELTICKEASIRWWLPLPPRPEINSVETG